MAQNTQCFKVESMYIDIAKKMMGVDELPESLVNKLERVEQLVKQVKPCGHLCSTQTIATLILQWEIELQARIDGII